MPIANSSQGQLCSTTAFLDYFVFFRLRLEKSFSTLDDNHAERLWNATYTSSENTISAGGRKREIHGDTHLSTGKLAVKFS